ncbi:MAG: PAS domain S-box protein, partial [Victivallales bacterium]
MRINRIYLLASAVILLSILFVFLDSMKHIIIPSLGVLQSLLVTLVCVIIIVSAVTYLIHKINCIHHEQIHRKQLENTKLLQALYSSEEKYRAVLENSSASIILMNCESLEKVYFNSRAYEILGYTKIEFTDVMLKDYVSQPFQDIKRRLERIALTGATENYESSYRRKNG